MSKHTPGPWHYQIDSHRRGRVFAGNMWLATTWTFPGDYGVGTPLPAGANARLIAAAPDLLAACKAALELAEGDDPGAGCDTREEAEAARCRWRESIEQSIRAAIAKAEGGAA